MGLFSKLKEGLNKDHVDNIVSGIDNIFSVVFLQ